MKALSKTVAVLTLFLCALAPALRAQDAPPPPDQGDQGDQGDQSDQGVSFQTFYDQLGDQGTWVQTDDYGYVFQPNVTDPDWAPYTDGHWVYTDDGWTWVSDESFGWATYHYGRWANIDDMGWVWVPGYQWAPAWVSWRYGGGYAGWAPLPPDTFYGEEYGERGGRGAGRFHFGGDVDVNFHIGAGAYNFIRVGDIGEPNYRGHFAHRSNNFVIINGTTNITSINVDRRGGGNARFRGVAAGGPPINEVNAHSRQRVQTVQLTEANQPGRSSLQGNSLAVFAPRMNPGTRQQARPARIGQTLSHPTFNRGDNISRPLAVTANIRPTAPTAEAVQAAQRAQASAPAHAKVATDKTPYNSTMTQPLSALEPVARPQRSNPTTPTMNGGNPGVEHNAATPFTGETPNRAPSQPSEVRPNAAANPLTGETVPARNSDQELNPAHVHPVAPANNGPVQRDFSPAPAPSRQTEDEAPIIHHQPIAPGQEYTPHVAPGETYHQSVPGTETYTPRIAPSENNRPETSPAQSFHQNTESPATPHASAPSAPVHEQRSAPAPSQVTPKQESSTPASATPAATQPGSPQPSSGPQGGGDGNQHHH